MCGSRIALCNGRQICSALNDYREVRSFPALRFRPIKSEDDRVPRIHSLGGQVGDVDAETCISRGRVLGGLPTVVAPTYECRRLSNYAQCFSSWQDAAFI